MIVQSTAISGWPACGGASCLDFGRSLHRSFIVIKVVSELSLQMTAVIVESKLFLLELGACRLFFIEYYLHVEC